MLPTTDGDIASMAAVRTFPEQRATPLSLLGRTRHLPHACRAALALQHLLRRATGGLLLTYSSFHPHTWRRTCERR